MRKGYVGVDGFREWIKIVRKYYPDGKELSNITGMAQGKISAIMEDRPYRDGSHGRLRKIDKLNIDTIDKAMTREGRFHLVEFYPEAYED